MVIASKSISPGWFGRRIAGFGVVSAAQGGIALLLVPLLCRGFPVVQLGQWAVIESILAVAPGMATLGGHHQILRLRGSAVDARNASAQSATGGSLAAALVISAAMVPVVAVAFGLVIGVLVCVNLFIDAALVVDQFRSRAKGDALGYAKATVARSAIFLALAGTTYGAVGDLSLWGVLIMRAIAGLAVGHRGICALKKARINQRRYRLAVRYGFPIALAAAALLLCDVVERLIMSAVVGSEGVTTYYVHARISGVMGLVFLAPLSMSFPSVRRAVRDLPLLEQDNTFSRFQLAAAGMGLALAASLTYVAPFVAGLVAPGGTSDRLVTAALVLGVLMRGLGTVFSIGLYSSSGSKQILRGGLVAVAIDAVVGGGLASLYGVAGMAVGSNLAAAAYLIWLSTHSRRQMRIGLHPMWVCGASLAIGLTLLIEMLGSRT